MAVASYSFGEVQVIPPARKVLVRGKPVALTARAYDLLLALIERRDHDVSKDEIFDAVWPGLAIEESNILVHVSLLRKALGASVIETVPGRGYRFAAAVVEEEEAPVPESRPGPGTNLPPSGEALIGRTADLEVLAERLRESRLVTIVGPGGVGKSRLAREAARRCTRELRHGVWRVDLAGLEPGEQAVSAAIAAAAGVTLVGSDPAAALVAELQPCEMLLVLDNCERLVTPAAVIADRLLAACAGVRIIATSQEPLRLSGERVHPLPPLALPPAGTPVADARQCAALRLLQRRVRALKPTYQLTNANVVRAVELCRRLDGLPLAIEMAAAHVPLLGLAALCDRVSERLDLLQNPDAEAPPRQRTLRAAFDWSHSLLTPVEQLALRRLAAFPGSFGLEEARQAMAADALDAWQALETLTSLCDKSLVMIDGGPAPRYRLLETTRLYVRGA